MNNQTIYYKGIKKKILIVFPDETIGYSPTILNLVNELTPFFEVEVICFDNGIFDTTRFTENKSYTVIKVQNVFLKITALFRVPNAYKLLLLFFIMIRFRRNNEVIAVDSIGLLGSTLFFKRVIFLSLEIRRDIFFRLAQKRKIKSLIIQTKERKEFLFRDCSKIKTFYIQNAPPFKPDIKKQYLKKNTNINLIYFGNIILQHGINQTIDVIKHENNNYILTLKGSIPPKVRDDLFRNYPDLFESGKLVLDEEYVGNDEIVNYLLNFQIGFCFYNFSMITKKHYYNYYTSPSGKIFNYFNAGVPVIAIKIPGLRSVEAFDAGILLEEITTANIKSSIDKIMQNYSYYGKNARKVAKYFNFKSNVQPFIEYLKT